MTSILYEALNPADNDFNYLKIFRFLTQFFFQHF